MVTINIEESLILFLGKHGNNHLKRELLLFWGLHPNARFNRLAISYAIDRSKLSIERVLKDMVEAGLLDTNARNGEILYSLTLNEEKRRPVLELTNLGWDRWRLMLKYIEQRLHANPN